MMTVVAAVLALGCGSAGVGQSPAPSESPSPFPGHVDGVTVLPAAVGVGQEVQLTAAVAAVGSIDRSVTWSLAAGAQGSVDALTGLYSAPATAGNFTVVATSVADATKKGSGAVTVTAVTTPPGALAAFPGAQGAGTRTPGGRGGAVYEVTKLSDDGSPGTLRYCVNQVGPRTCVFRVGGTIELASSLVVRQPFLTIAGQTAPGGGIALSGRNLSSQVLAFYTHDVVVRYLRIRKGYNAASAGTSQAGQTTAYRTGAYNIVVDHCSISWTQDENVTLWADSGAPHDVTVSWSIVAEPLADHPTSIISGSNSSAQADAEVDLDFHHNYVANSSHRNPLLKNKRSRFVNNVVYNWLFYATQIGGGGQMDVVGNLYAAGPLTASGGYGARHEVQVFPGGNATTATGSPSIHVSGNAGPRNPDASADNWGLMVREVAGENQAEIGLLSAAHQRATALAPAASGIPIQPEPVAGLAAAVLPQVGAAMRVDCDGTWKPARDAADGRVVGDYAAGTGAYPSRETDQGFGGMPALAAGTACVDTDHDGVPDVWEAARGLDPADPADGGRAAANGYTNLENYLNGQ